MDARLNEIEKLKSDRARLIEALTKALADLGAEFQAMGADWKDQPIMVRKMKNLSAARSLLRELEGPK